MIQKTLHTKKELKRLFMDLKHKGVTDEMMGILIDVLWRDKTSSRTSGFFWPGGPDLDLTWDNLTRTLTLTPAPTLEPESDYVPHFRFFSHVSKPTIHRRYVAESIVLPNEEGLYAVYYDVNDVTRLQSLTYSKNPDDFATSKIIMKNVVIAWIYWDATAMQAIYLGDSRHGSEWPPQVHYWVHKTLNSQRQDGIAITDATFEGDGSNVADADFGISAGTLWHEDIFAEAPTVGVADSLPVWYFDAAGLPRFTTQTGKKFINTGTGMLAFNPPAGGIAEASDLNHVVYHIFATNCMVQSHISVMGQSQYLTIAEAAAAIAPELVALRAALPHSNLMHVASLVFQTSVSFTNSTMARVAWSGTDENTYVTDLSFDEGTRILTLKQNDLPDLSVEIPGATGELTDEKVKYNAADTAAGYLSDKIIAGANILLVEGTGVNENKLVISTLGESGIGEYIVYNESELLEAWTNARLTPAKAAIIYIAANITLTANRAFLISAGQQQITFKAVSNQSIIIGTREFTISRVVCRDLIFRTSGQTYVTVDGNYADFYNCQWLDEVLYNPAFSAMKIAIKLKGTITNATGKLTIENPRHASQTYSTNFGNIQPFIIQSTSTGWGTTSNMYIELIRVDAVLSFDTFSKVLLHATANVPFKISGDLTWFYHPDQVFPGTGFILAESILLKKGSVDDLFGSFIPEATIQKLIGVDETGRIRKSNVDFSNTAHTHDDRYYTETETDSLLVGKSDANHGDHGLAVHAALSEAHPRDQRSQIAGSYEPTIGAKNSAFNKNFGTAVDTVTQGNDTRLSDARTPLAHTHTKSQVTDFAHTHVIDDLPVASSGTSNTTQVVRADDSRLSDSRTPVAHTHDDRYYTETESNSLLTGKAATEHGDHGLSVHAESSAAHPRDTRNQIAGSYEVAFSKNTAFNKNFGTTAGTVVEGNDSRLEESLADNAVSYAKIGNDLKTSAAISASNIDWSSAGIFTKTLTAATTFTFNNLQLNKVITLVLTGNYAITWPAYVHADYLVSGEYYGSKINYIQIHCTNAGSGTEQVWWAIKTEGA